MEKLIYSIIIVLIVHCTLNIDNSEAQWVQTPGIPSGGGITDMVIADNGNIVVTTASFNWPNGQDGGVRWSSDEGATWNSPFNYFNARTLALGQNGWIFCSAWDFPDTERLYASSDNGQTWPMSLFTVGSNDNIFSILARDNNQTVYIGTRNGVLKSTNGGLNFISINNKIPSNSWVRDLESDSLGNLAAATTNGLFTSTNAGSNWQLINGIPSTDTIIKLYTVYSQIFDGKIDSYILSGSNNKRIYLAQYQNAVPTASFTPSPNPEELIDFSAKVYVFNDNIKYELFVWTYGGGFYRTIDRGVTWVQLNNGLPQNPLISAGTNIKLDLNANGNTIKFFCGLNENSLNGARVFSLDYKVGIQSISTEIPDNFSLEQNYPNPFNPETKINFSIKEKSLVKINVFDALGKELDELVNEELSPGTYQTNFNGSGYTSGIYFYRLTTDKINETKKMILKK